VVQSAARELRMHLFAKVLAKKGVKDDCTREIHEDSEALGLVGRCDW